MNKRHVLYRVPFMFVVGYLTLFTDYWWAGIVIALTIMFTFPPIWSDGRDTHV